MEERAEPFGKMVADSLLQCDPKDWIILKKKVMDMFFDYEQQKANIPQQFSLQLEVFSSMFQQAANINPHGQGPFSPSSNYSNDSFSGN